MLLTAYCVVRFDLSPLRLWSGMGELEAQSRAEGMRNMYEDGLVKSLAGVTTIEEVLRVTQEG